MNLNEVAETPIKVNNMKRFEYHINLNERGVFKADVRAETGETVYDISIGDESYETPNLFDDGFMKHMHDMDGLTKYMNDLGIMSEKDYLVDMNPNER